MYATCGNQCFSFKIKGGKVRKVEETSLKCSHEEVDSPMLFHAKFINAPKNMSYEQLITLCNMAKLFQGLKA